MTARARQPQDRTRRGSIFRRLTGSDEKRIRRRQKELHARLRALGKAAYRPGITADARAFLLLALGRLEGLVESLPEPVRTQELTLSWIEGILEPLERQASALPPELAPFATRLPTTVEEERRRAQALSLLEAAGSRIRREREEILASLDEVEESLGRI